jgi:hypothetical protein
MPNGEQQQAINGLHAENISQNEANRQPLSK